MFLDASATPAQPAAPRPQPRQTGQQPAWQTGQQRAPAPGQQWQPQWGQGGGYGTMEMVREVKKASSTQRLLFIILIPVLLAALGALIYVIVALD